MSDLTQRLQLIVDATGDGAEAAFRKLTGAANDTGQAAQRSATDVAGAADRVAQAQLKAQDAAGQLRVAQQRLQDLQEKGGASAGQLAAAEERVEAAQRRSAVAARGVEAALNEERSAQERATAAVNEGAEAEEKHSRAGEKMREQVGELRNTVVGFVAGYSLADWAKESFEGFTEGARGAQSLAISMNASVEQAGQLNTLMGSLGLEADDLLEIQASFAQVVGANDQALSGIGATLKTNTDGTTNWALSIEDTLTQLQRIPDATKRNQVGFQLFGEEGYKQLSRLLNSGVSVSDALDRIGVPFHDEDVAAVQEYDRAMSKLSQTSGGLSRDLGRELLPIITGVLDAFGKFVEVIGAVPAPVTLATGAAILLGLAQRSASAEGGILAGVLQAVTGRAAGLRTAAAEAAVSTTLLGRGMGAARVAGGGLMGLLGGPAGLAVLAIGAGFELYNRFLGQNSAQAKAAEAANSDLAAALKTSNGVVTDAVRQQAAQSAQQANILSVTKKLGLAQGTVTDAVLGNKDALRQVNSALDDYMDKNRDAAGGDISFGDHLNNNGDAARDAKDALADLTKTTGEGKSSQQELAQELGKTTDKTQLATQATEALTDMVAAGTTTGQAFTDATKAAADATAAQSASSDTAKAAMDAYVASTRDAVKSVLDLINARYASEDANFGFLQAMDDAKKATDDSKTSVNEARQAQVKLYEAALSAASAAGDAAVNSAKAQGQVLTTTAEANTRADAMINDLRAKLNTPGLAASAKAELQGIVDQLQQARDKGDVKATIALTGTKEATDQLDATTKDRTATVTTKSAGGPAVISYLDGIAGKDRLAIIKVESRGGPAADTYLDGLRGRDRLAIIRVETRGGPAVDVYLDGLTKERLAIIRVETRGGPDVARYLDGLASKDRVARIGVAATPTGSGRVPTGWAPSPAQLRAAATTSGAVNIGQLIVQPQVDGGGRLTAAATTEAGRQYVAAIRKYEQHNGAGWRRTP